MLNTAPVPMRGVPLGLALVVFHFVPLVALVAGFRPVRMAQLFSLCRRQQPPFKARFIMFLSFDGAQARLRLIETDAA